MIYKWFADFRCGRMSTSDAELSGRPADVTTPQITEKFMSTKDRNSEVNEGCWHIIRARPQYFVRISGLKKKTYREMDAASANLRPKMRTSLRF